MNVRIYTMTHKKFNPPEDAVYVPLQVGRARGGDLGYPGDDTGDNISDLNEFYGELTGLYWIWKNDADSDIIGICHYRRFFLNEKGTLMTAEEYERVLSEYDVMTSNVISNGGTNEENFANAHDANDMKAVGRAIQKLYPNDYAAFRKVMEQESCCYANLMVTTRARCMEYCEWLFSILAETRGEIDLENRDLYHRRIFGFLSEVLLEVWVAARGLKRFAGKVGVTAEKAETVEFKKVMGQLIRGGDIAQAKELFYGYRRLRPDIGDGISDIKSEIPVIEQLLYIMSEEKKAGEPGLLAYSRELVILMAHYKNIRMLLSKGDFDTVRERGAAYFAENPVSDTALRVICAQMRGEQSLYEYLNEGRPPKKVSVIVPVYNAEKQFAGCIGNLVHQTLEDIEIIFIDDCSTDKSLAILRECQRQYPEKVRVIASEKNSRAGGARNRGLDVAAGEYIGFVDSDDLPDVRMFEKLYSRAAETGADIVDGGFLYEKENRAVCYTADEDTGVQTGEKRRRLIAGGGYLVTKLVRRSLFERYRLRYRENIPMLEDADILTFLLSVAENIGNLKEVIYCYRDTEGSLSKKCDRDSYLNSLYEAMTAIYEKEHTLPVYGDIREAVEYEMLQMYSYAVNACADAYLKGENYPVDEWLEKFRAFRIKYISPGYRNPYVADKIPRQDCRIMEMNDENPKKLLETLK